MKITYTKFRNLNKQKTFVSDFCRVMKSMFEYYKCAKQDISVLATPDISTLAHVAYLGICFVLHL